MRVLVCDDDPIIRRLLNSMIARLSHEPVEASDGLEAWEMITSDADLDAIICDWHMPGMDGIELCQRLREREGNHERTYTYFVLLTGEDRRQNLVEAARHGADSYLTKPIPFESVSQELTKAERVTSLHRRLAKQREQLARLRCAKDDLPGG